MVKRLTDVNVLPSPGLREAAVLDRMCSQFVLTLTVRHAGRFNLRRDFNGLLSFTGRHLVWPVRVLSAAARLSEPTLQRQRAVDRPRAPERRGLPRTPRRLERPLRRRHAVLLSRRIRQGRAQGHAGPAGHHQRMAGPAAQA